jgi:hypothetical protein
MADLILRNLHLPDPRNAEVAQRTLRADDAPSCRGRALYGLGLNCRRKKFWTHRPLCSYDQRQGHRRLSSGDA